MVKRFITKSPLKDCVPSKESTKDYEMRSLFFNTLKGQLWEINNGLNGEGR